MHQSHDVVLTCRRMDVTDLDSVAAIEQKNQSHPWPHSQFVQSLEKGHDCFVVIDAMCKVVAFVVYQTVLDEANLLLIGVDPCMQRQGIGQWLMMQSQNLLSAACCTIFLEVRASNQAAITFYDKLGFNEIGIRARYYPRIGGGWEDAVMMALVIC